jgi:hypothetical protein
MASEYPRKHKAGLTKPPKLPQPSPKPSRTSRSSSRTSQKTAAAHRPVRLSVTPPDGNESPSSRARRLARNRKRLQRERSAAATPLYGGGRHSRHGRDGRDSRDSRNGRDEDTAAPVQSKPRPLPLYQQFDQKSADRDSLLLSGLRRVRRWAAKAAE